MGIFNKNNKLVEAVDQPANYNTALDYLIGLSAEDFAKVVKIAEAYRQTDYVAAGILGIENKPSTFIKKPVQKEPVLSEYKVKFEKLPIKPKAKKGKK